MHNIPLVKYLINHIVWIILIVCFLYFTLYLLVNASFYVLRFT